MPFPQRPSMRRARSRPQVVINMAMSADGKIASANRAIETLGSPADYKHLLQLRASADAILCGARTVNDPEITLGGGDIHWIRARRRQGLADYALRVVVTGSGSLRPDSGVFLPSPAPLIILTTTSAPQQSRARWRECGAVVKTFGRKTVDLGRALAWLAAEWNVRRLICEGGGQLNEAMLRAALVDEIRVTLCPKILGGREAPSIADGSGVSQLSRAHGFHLAQVRRRGDELYLTLRALPAPASP